MSNELCDAITLQCAYILDIDSPEFDEIFVQATALNPLLAKKYLNDKQFSYAESSIKEIVSFYSFIILLNVTKNFYVFMQSKMNNFDSIF